MVFSTFTFKGLLGQLSESSLSKHLTCVFRTYSQLQPTNLTYFSLLISRQVVGALTYPNTSLVSPGLTPNLSLSRYTHDAHLQASCRSFHLSKHLTCVSRTYSQLQPVEIFLMLISRQVVGVFTCPNTSLVSPGLTPNFSLSRYSKHFKT